jgi:hypothetical protein
MKYRIKLLWLSAFERQFQTLPIVFSEIVTQVCLILRYDENAHLLKAFLRLSIVGSKSCKIWEDSVVMFL